MDALPQTLNTQTLAPVLGISLSTLRKIVCDPKRVGIECPPPLNIPMGCQKGDVLSKIDLGQVSKGAAATAPPREVFNSQAATVTASRASATADANKARARAANEARADSPRSGGGQGMKFAIATTEP